MTTETINEKLLKDIKIDEINAKPIDIKKIAACVDTSDHVGLFKISSYIIEKKFIRKVEWDHLMHRNHVSKEFDSPYPETPMDFINMWTKHYCLDMDFKGNFKSKSFRTDHLIKLYENYEKIEEELKNSSNINEIKSLTFSKRNVSDQINACEFKPTLDIINRKIRITRDTYKLKFTDSQISDSLEEWCDIYKSTLRGKIFSSIVYINDANEKNKADVYLDKICDGLFDQSHLTKDAQKNILRKFIWQVKRKIKGEIVTNHIMPVFTGPQGTGKSTFMHRFIDPVAELSSPTDFKQLTDDRNISLFKNAILIVDEMGFANKADIETVKSIMTATELSRRPMRQNTSVNIRQDATFIGASNKELEQLIRDETGLRRFIGIQFKKEPDWEMIKGIEYDVIWRSIDEDSSDPSMNSINDIQFAQEMARCKTPCEMWVKTLSEKQNGKRTASNWYREYGIWETYHFHNKRMDFDNWCKELRRLIACNKIFPFTYSMNGNTEMFEYKENV